MITIKNGDLLKATESVICHQCNTRGLFGGGLAYQIKQIYPLCEKRTMDYLEHKKDFMGTYYLHVNKQNKKLIANCFTQNEDFTTNYEMLKKCFINLKENCKDMKQSIAIPYGYGCGVAKGDWNEVYKIIESIFTDYDISIYKLGD